MEQVQAGSQGGNSLAKSRLEKMSEQILSRESKYQSDCSVASRDNIDRTRDIVGKHYHDHSHANAHQVQDKIDHQPGMHFSLQSPLSLPLHPLLRRLPAPAPPAPPPAPPPPLPRRTS